MAFSMACKVSPDVANNDSCFPSNLFSDRPQPRKQSFVFLQPDSINYYFLNLGFPWLEVEHFIGRGKSLVRCGG